MNARRSFFLIMVGLMYVGAMSNGEPAYADEITLKADDVALQIGRVRIEEGSDFFTLEFSCNTSRTTQAGQQRRDRSCQLMMPEAKDFIQVEPQMAFQVIAAQGRFRLVGPFAPRSSYTVTFQPGLPGKNRALLPQQVSKVVETPALKPMLRFMGRARYLPPLHGASLPYEARNVERLQATFQQIFPQNLVFWLTKRRELASSDVAEQVHLVQQDIMSQPDQKTTGLVDLDALNQFGPGVFHITLNNVTEKTARQLDSATVVITDVVSIAKQDGDDLFVWTRSAASMNIKRGVHVRVMSYSNREIASCTTGGPEASCVLPGVMRQRHKPFALLFTIGNDLSYLRFSDVGIIDERSQTGMRPYLESSTSLDAYVYSSRGVYRPGETVNLGAVVWSTTRQAARDVPLQWEILTPRKKVLREVSMNSSRVGMATLDVQLDDYAPTGKYQAILKSGKLKLQTYGFFVEEFVPERIGVAVESKQEVFIATSQADFDLGANYLFGPPVADGAYTLRCTLQPAWFHIPNHGQFATGRYLPEPPPPIVLEPVAGKLDAQGRATAACDFERFRHVFPTVMKVNAAVEVKEAGSGRVTLQNTVALAAASDELIGLHSLRADNQRIHLEGRLFTPQGEQIQRDAQVALSIYQVSTNWLYVWDPKRQTHRWQREEILLPEGGRTTVAIEAGRFEAQLDTQQSYGAYVVRAELGDKQVVSDLQVSLGYGWYWQARHATGTPKPPSPEQIKIVLSQDEIEAGETFSAQFEAPFNGYALVAVESDQLHEHRWLEVQKGPQQVDLIAPARLPNVYVSVLILKDPIEANYYVPGRAWGNAVLRIQPRAHTMAIAIDAPDSMRPQQELKITLRADPQEATQFTVAVVDEGILQLTDFETPDALGYFFQPRRLGVKTFETVGWTFARSLDANRNPGGGRRGGKGRSPRVIPVTILSFWSGVVDSDATGKAVVRVPIPQFQGSVRIMVLGASKQRTGWAEQFVTIRDPLVLQATLPRFLIWQDNLTIPVFVANTTGATQEVTLRVRANDAMQIDATPQTANIDKDQSAVFYIPAEVKGFAGTATFTMTVSGGAFTTRDTFRIPVIPFSPEKTVSQTVAAGQIVTLTDLIPDDLRTEGLRLEVSVATIPFLKQLARLRYLMRYPYGCIEQTTSGTFPLLYLSDLLHLVDPEIVKDRDVTSMVYSGINRLISMQTTSGGFSYWPGRNDPTLWGTAYVTHLLLKARELGYSVPNGSLSDALDFMQEAVVTRRYEYDKKYRRNLVESEPYMLYVLGLAGRHQSGRLRQFTQQPPDWGELETENEFLLMLAYYLAGDQRGYENYSNRKSIFQPMSLLGRHHSRTFWSSFRTDAMRLSLSEDVWPQAEVAEPLALKVASVMGNRRHLSTQETSWAVTALGKRAARYQDVDISGVELLLDGEVIAPTMRHQDNPVWSLSGYPFVDQTLQLTSPSEKKPIVHIRMHGYVRDYAALQHPNVPFRLSRRYLDLQGQPIGPRAWRQGELAVVELSIESSSRENIQNIAIVDRLPAGFEIENPRLGREHNLEWLPEDELFKPDYLDLRDDRLQIFGELPKQLRSKDKRLNAIRKFYYIVRAVTPGTFVAPPALLEVMYDPEQFYYTDYERVKIARP